MYRGDDIYLLDFWPLDDVNTVGGGAWFEQDRLNVGAHVGINRLADPFQFQERDVVAPEFGTETVSQLDRQRYIGTLRSTYRFWGGPNGPAMKAKLWGEIHALDKGQRLREDNTVELLPSDFGYTVGGQLGAYDFAEGATFANLFFRLSKGLTAFDELDVPSGLDSDMKSFPGASELLLGLSANYDFPGGGAMLGGYARRFSDADRNVMDRDDGWEYVIDARPHFRIIQALAGAVDVSYQARFPRGISPISLIAMDPAIFQIAPMLVYSPMGTESYARPQFRLVYRAAHLNEGALDTYAPDDPRRAKDWVHFLGIQAEWWFNSASYRSRLP